jgi:uncharacterized membrane protein YtjA (UPF0391 family)
MYRSLNEHHGSRRGEPAASAFSAVLRFAAAELPSLMRKGGCPRREEQMLHWSLIFLIIAIIAAIFGFAGIAGAAAGIAKILFVVFLVIWLIAFIAGRRAV